MPMDPDNVLHFEAVVLAEDAGGWPADRLARVLDALRTTGFAPAEPGGVERMAQHVGSDEELGFTGQAGRHSLTLTGDGGWFWHTPGATLMEDRHNNRPEAVDEVVAAVRAVVEAAPPYFGRTWYATQMSPYWMRTDEPFVAQDAGAITFFSGRYLAEHAGGRPLADPPVRSLSVGDGQLLVAEPNAFGEATVAGLTALNDWLHDVQRSRHRCAAGAGPARRAADMPLRAANPCTELRPHGVALRAAESARSKSGHIGIPGGHHHAGQRPRPGATVSVVADPEAADRAA